MKLNFLKALKQEEHRSALYSTMICVMVSTLFFLLVSMDQPDKEEVEIIIPIDMENVVIPEEMMESLQSASGGQQGHANEIVHQTNNPGEQVNTQNTVSVPVNGNPANNPQPDNGLAFGGETGNGVNTTDGPDFGLGPDVAPNGINEANFNGKRVLSKHPQFNGTASEEGKIALEIWVDENGNVAKTRFLESKSTSGDEYLIKLAEKAAKTMKYEVKPGAGLEKVPYQVFEFKKV